MAGPEAPAQSPEGEEEGEVEVAAPKQVRSPIEPTAAEIAEHEVLGHVQYREWCRHCVAARGIGQQHRSREQRERQNDGLPTVACDYCFMGQDDGKVKPILVIKDSKTQAIAATFVEAKGTDPYAIKFWQGFVKHLGYKKFIAKSDGEPAIKAMKAKAIDGLKGIEAISQETPEGDHQANGLAEVAVREVKRQVRVMKSSLEEKLGITLSDEDPVLAWLPRHGADLLTRYRKGEDGRTPEQRRSGKAWRRPALELGERLFYREAVAAESNKNDLHMKMLEGRYIGHHGGTGALLVITPNGVKKAQGVRRLPPEQRWDAQGWTSLRGYPWDVAHRAGRSHRLNGEGPLPVQGPAPVLAPPVQRRLYILKADVERLGPTPGCPGCTCVLLGESTQVNHTEACRARMMELLAQDERGKARIEAHELRQRRRPEPPEREEELRVADAVGEPEASGVPEAGGRKKKRGTSSPGSPGTLPVGKQTPQKRGAESRPTELEKETAKPMSADERARRAYYDLDEPPPAQSEPSAASGIKRTAEEPPESLDPRATSSGDVEELVSQPVVQQQAEEQPPQSMQALSSLKRETALLVQGMVRNKYRAEQVDVTEQEVMDIASLCTAMGAVDVMEIYSPKRFTEHAPRLGLLPGYAVDLCETKPNSEEHWDLSREEDRKELEELIDAEEPRLLTGGPPCEAFSRLQALNQKRVSPEVRKKRREQGEQHLHLSIKMYRKQMEKGRYFLHEHPWSADSWYDEEVKALAEDERVYVVKGPMCKWEMKANDVAGNEGYVRKETGWMTNSPVLAEILQGECSNKQGGLWHRHVRLIGGIARGAAVYPPKLVNAVLKGLKEQMVEDGSLSAVDAYAAGPVPEEPSMPAGNWYQYWDDVNGGYLDSEGVLKARQLEMEYIHKQGVWKRVPLDQCIQETGKQPIPLKWVDTNKGDHTNPNLRSRLVVKDIKARKGPEDQLDPAMLFSAMPPLEAVRILTSMLMSKQRSKHGRPLRLGSWDISRAHFYGTPKRNIYVKLPEEEGAGEGECGLLLKSMYGTQDAPAIWQDHYTQTLIQAGWKRGRSNGAVFYHPVLDARVLVHGDDFLCLGDEAAQEALDKTLREAYELKRTGEVGIGVAGSNQITFLNRVIRLEQHSGRPCAVIEADSRHAELLIEELGLNNGKGVETADVKKSVDQQLLEAKAAALPPEMVKQYRSLVMRAAYLAQDRADIGHAVKTLSRKMVMPTDADWGNLKRLARYLKQYPYAKLVYEQQREPTKLRIQVDADHAGDAVTRRSTTGMIAFYGQHPIKHSSNVQSTIALSTGESEYYALVKAGSTGLGIQSLLEDWSCELEVVLETDSNAAKGQGSRIGLGKARHVQTRYLWLQERVAADHLRIHKVLGEKNCSDILTKSVGGPTLRKHLKTLGVQLSSEKSRGHKELLL